MNREAFAEPGSGSGAGYEPQRLFGNQSAAWRREPTGHAYADNFPKPCWDLAFIDVVLPTFFESREGKRRRDIMSEIRPQFMVAQYPLNGLHSGIDYRLDYFHVPCESAPSGFMVPVDSITTAGEYRLVITGISDTLLGCKVVPFVVQRHEKLRNSIFGWFRS